MRLLVLSALSLAISSMAHAQVTPFPASNGVPSFYQLQKPTQDLQIMQLQSQIRGLGGHAYPVSTYMPPGSSEGYRHRQLEIWQMESQLRTLRFQQAMKQQRVKESQQHLQHCDPAHPRLLDFLSCDRTRESIAERPTEGRIVQQTQTSTGPTSTSNKSFFPYYKSY